MRIINEIGSSAPPYIIFGIAIALITLLSSYIIFLINMEAPIWKWRKGLFGFFTWVSILFILIAGLMVSNLIMIIIETPQWWQLLVKCLLALSFFTLFFLVTELVHYIKDTMES